MQANKNVVDLAVWEHKTDGVIKKNILMKRYETLLQEAHQKLEQRRARCVYPIGVFERLAPQAAAVDAAYGQ